jgi:hypothetical protein
MNELLDPSAFPGASSNQISAMTQIENTRVAQEVQAAVILAKRYPRDQLAAFTNIMKACGRKEFAKVAVYAYPRGREAISGPSIRLAEAMLQSWGNVMAGIREIESDGEKTTIEAYAWDLETNYRPSKTFSVRHERKANGKVSRLDDPRDVYEHVANYGSRRLRAMILSVMPKDIVDTAYKACLATIKAEDAGLPIVDRVRKMAIAFGEIGVSIPMIEKWLGSKIDLITAEDLNNLQIIYLSIRNGDGKREDYFAADPASIGPAVDLNQKFAPKKDGDGTPES